MSENWFSLQASLYVNSTDPVMLRATRLVSLINRNPIETVDAVHDLLVELDYRRKAMSSDATATKTG